MVKNKRVCAPDSRGNRVARGSSRSIDWDHFAISTAGRVRILLPAFLVGSGLAVLGADVAAKRPTSEAASSTAPVQGTPPRASAQVCKLGALSELPKGAVARVDLICFHPTKRCTTSMNLENYTRETVEKHFPEPVKRGLISLRVLDVEKAENAPMVKKFGAGSTSLHLSILVEGTEYLYPVQDALFYATNKYLFVEKLKEVLTSLVGGP